jgi:hypothetical protein
MRHWMIWSISFLSRGLPSCTMLTIDKFHDAVTAHFKWARTYLWRPTVIAASLFLITGILARLFPEGHLPDYFPTGPMLAFGIFVFFELGLAVWHHDIRARRDPRLNCSHCNRPLQVHWALVIATRNCPHCGQRVLAEPSGD